MLLSQNDIIANWKHDEFILPTKFRIYRDRFLLLRTPAGTLKNFHTCEGSAGTAIARNFIALAKGLLPLLFRLGFRKAFQF